MWKIELIDINHEGKDTYLDQMKRKMDKQMEKYKRICKILLGVLVVEAIIIWILQAGPI